MSRTWEGGILSLDSGWPRLLQRDSGNAFDLHGGAVRQDFRDPFYHFGGVITHPNHGVCAVVDSVLQKQFECVLASLLAEIREDGDVAADNGLQSGAEIPETLRERTAMPKFLTMR
jgi:hypothetical protein